MAAVSEKSQAEHPSNTLSRDKNDSLDRVELNS